VQVSLVSLLSQRDDGVAIEVSVRPKAGRCRLRGVCGGRLKIEVTAAPEGGLATTQAMKTLADAVGVRASDVVLLCGARDRHKTFLVRGVSLEQVDAMIQKEA